MLVTLDQVKEQAGVTLNEDDDLLTAKIAAAEGYLESALGYSIAERYTAAPPAPLVEAALQLVAHWYENREAAGESLKPIPFSVTETIQAYRDWSF
jgi:uncharacterized phage protein (predicted DNA packaging)